MTEIIQTLDLNTLLIASVSLAAAGIIGFWFKDFPKWVFRQLKRQLTTSVYLTTANISFFTLLEWIAHTYKDRNFRDYKLSNGRWGHDDDGVFTIGYGGHFIRYQHHFFYISLEEKESQGVERDKEVITIRKLGRNRKIFDEFVKEITTPLPRDTVEIYQLHSNYWSPRGELPQRSMDSVFIEKFKKNELLQALNNFVNNEEWYLQHGIPYQLGILLYGVPGSGKSSLIKAIASYLKYDIYYLSASQLYKLEDGLDSLPEKNSILVIEDIDCEPATHQRFSPKDREEIVSVTGPPDKINSLDRFMTITNLADILNLVDGLCSTHGRIMIITTNYIEKLDPALIRPGRIDLKLEVGYVNREIFDQFSMSFFGRYLVESIYIPDKLTCAELQDMVLQGMELEDVVRCIL